MTTYTITHPDGRSEVFRPFLIAEGIPRATDLGPGQTVRGYARLFFASQGPVFTSAGDYTIICRGT